MGTLRINRARVLTLWAAVVAERLGMPRDKALTMGQTLAGLTAHAKGVRLGIYAAPEERPHEPPPPLPAGVREVREASLFGRRIHVAETKHGPRAIAKGEVVKPASVEHYLRSRFGDALAAVRAEMEALAAHFPPDELDRVGVHLYEQFRPEVPSEKAHADVRRGPEMPRHHTRKRTAPRARHDGSTPPAGSRASCLTRVNSGPAIGARMGWGCGRR